MEEYKIDELDTKILQYIANNSRISFLEVARLCNVSGAAVHQRVQRMTNSKIITGSQFTLDMTKVGYDTCAYVSLSFDQASRIDTVVDQIEKIPEVVECYHTLGLFDILVKIYAKSNSHLLRIIQTQLKPLGVIRSETIISCRESFCRQLPFDDSVE
ncbi:MAG: Lrp/AsnC ligand binding domain-containing protein [Rikenellaceae bacterium]